MKSYILIIATLLILGGCSSLGQRSKLDTVALIYKPIAVKLGDNHWILNEPLTYRVKQTEHVIIVPKGFITDLASTPRPLWAIGLSPIDSYMSAAIVHDYLYWDQRCTKSQADDVLSLAMEESYVHPVQSYLVYQGVNLFGNSSWNRNSKLRNGGEQRFMTESYTQYIVNTASNTSESLGWIQKDASSRNGIRTSDDSNPQIRLACEAATVELAKLQ